ncbi:TniQ family protein [Pseudorhodoferax sp. Leaf265]|uniref:TniQ family protein n=1 Tax=Pseudorhodoferax sp. Leaf265 TaxID=1736315 RepID=UPI0006FD1ECC|nr:TniQ family protein [Pseudorhodoferax sp. Leaf265]KQP17052.1 hypothetical protein ASF45_27935 [Pseudorhodoferax sp. Leaf265]
MLSLESRKITPLYGLALRRTEAGDPESIYSYVLRLAFEHRVIPLALARTGLIAPQNNLRGELFMCRDGAALLGGSDFAMATCQSLSEATGVKDLHGGTLLPLRSIAASQQLLSRVDRVCLSCIREDVCANRKTFGRLLWRLHCVSCCPVHREQLVEVSTCPVAEPAPGKPVQIYGVCQRCASVGYECRPPAESASAEDVDTSAFCRDLLAVAADLPPDYAATAKRSLKEFSRNFVGGCAAIATGAAINKSLLSRFLNEPQARLQLSSLVNVAKVLNIGAVDLVRGNFAQASTAPSLHVDREKCPKRKIDHAELRAALSHALSDDSLTIAKLSKSLDVDRKLLRLANPDAYALIVQRNLERLDVTREEDWNSALRRAAAMLRRLREMGLKPNLRNASVLDSETWQPSNQHSKLLLALASPAHKGVATYWGFPARLFARIRHLVQHDALRTDGQELTIRHILGGPPRWRHNTRRNEEEAPAPQSA